MKGVCDEREKEFRQVLCFPHQLQPINSIIRMSRLGPLLRSYTTIEDEQGLIESTIPQEIADGQFPPSLPLFPTFAYCCTTYPTGLSSGEWKLIEIVKGLQDSLTSENDKVRSRGKLSLFLCAQSLREFVLIREC